MRFAVASAVLAGTAAALPHVARTPETVTISGLTIYYPYDTPTVVNSVSFTLSGDNATDLVCSAENPALGASVFACGDSKYRFGLGNGKDTQYALSIYHELGTAFGRYAVSDVVTHCHTAGAPNEVCNQMEPLVFDILSA